MYKDKKEEQPERERNRAHQNEINRVFHVAFNLARIEVFDDVWLYFLAKYLI